jgi:arginase family enzyme
MFVLIIQTGFIPLALGGDHTMTYPILQAIKVHICANNTDRIYILSFRWRPHYDLSYTPGY